LEPEEPEEEEEEEEPEIKYKVTVSCEPKKK
jgi:hypothetical protein